MSRKDKKIQRMTLAEQRDMIGDELSFAGAEAYKLLRTNLMMTVTDESCPIIGVTSAVPGEAKSTTAINLAYALVQDGKRVLLMESDLRLPTLAKRLKIQSEPGLTNLLVGMCSGTEALQHCDLHRNLRLRILPSCWVLSGWRSCSRPMPRALITLFLTCLRSRPCPIRWSFPRAAPA